MVEEISEGCWPKRKRELDGCTPRKFWSQEPPAYSQNDGDTFMSIGSTSRLGIELSLTEQTG
jgi:hypothetical protein